LAHVVLLLLGLPATAWAGLRRQRRLAVLLGSAAITGLLLLWLFTSASDPVWQLLGQWLGRLQYRSRLMGVQALATAAVAGLSLSLLPARWQRRGALFLSLSLLLLALPSLYVNLQHLYGPFGDTLTLNQVRSAEIASGGSAFTSFGEFTPHWRVAPFDDGLLKELGPSFSAENRPLANAPGEVEVIASRVRSSSWDLVLGADQPRTLTLHLLYYPRWRAFVDGQAAELRPQAKTGYAQLDMPAGQHAISLHYASTTVEIAALVVSALILLGLLAGAFWPRSRRRQPAEGIWPERKSPDGVACAAVTREPGVLVPGGEAAQLPPLWLLCGLSGLLLLKVLYIDNSTTWLRCVSTQDRVCGTHTTVDVPFGQGLHLRGYDVPSPAVRPGETLRVRLFWQADSPTQVGLVAFVHVRNSRKEQAVNPLSENEIWAQEDHVGPGGFFTTWYRPGRIYLDEYYVALPKDMPPGSYYLEVGWNNPYTGEQLDPLADSVKPPLRVLWRSVLLPSIEVK
jgi:hypothetical protein